MEKRSAEPSNEIRLAALELNSRNLHTKIKTEPNTVKIQVSTVQTKSKAFKTQLNTVETNIRPLLFKRAVDSAVQAAL